ncbi:uncharacterized protein [Centruroides vittatus]|uniref:uncharacterized protein n=1 Tax=Centruroides vittatus TaxID=120091 RepID=UPI00350F7202
MVNHGKHISGVFLRNLFHLQRDHVIKPVRCLTFKHVYPTNFDKMKVKRAVDICSQNVIAALKFLQKHGHRFENLNFVEAEGTIEYLEIMQKWFAIHNISNTQHHIHSRNATVMQFVSANDERLNWLDGEFLGYLPVACRHWKRWKRRFHLSMTLYLLEKCFDFILTRKFNSDDIENLFSGLRSMSGFNDQTNACSIMQGLHTILKTGLISASLESNAESLDCEEWMSPNEDMFIIVNQACMDKNYTIKEVTKHIEPQLKQLEIRPSNIIKPNIQSATMAYIAGYLVRITEEKIECSDCLDILASVKSPAPIMGIINLNDLGGLLYPKVEFIGFLQQLEKAIHAGLPFLIQQPAVMHNLCKIILPWMEKNPLFMCGKDGHQNILCNVILRKFIRPYISNYTRTVNDTYIRENHRPKTSNNKALSRKIIKVAPL